MKNFLYGFTLVTIHLGLTTKLMFRVLLLLLLVLAVVSFASSTSAVDIPTEACETTNRAAPPVIDVKNVHDPALKETVLQALQQWGFFQVINHNITDELIDRLRTEMLWFFSQPLEAKLKVKRNATNARGFAHDELTKQLPDYKEIFDYGFGAGEVDGVNLWPEAGNRASSFHDTLKEYFDESTKLSQSLMDLVAQSLEVDSDIFRNAFRKHSSFARLNYYPTWNGSEEDQIPMGISRHTDAGGLTILWQDSPGLQVYSGTKQDNADGEWVDMRVVPGALIVNIGDMLEVWCGGQCRAAEHRVVIKPGKRTHRLSVPFFYNPDYEQIMQPLTGTRKFRPFTWKRFRTARFAGDYANLGKESQIEDYELY